MLTKNFTIRSVLSESWNLVSGLKWPVFLLSLLQMIILITEMIITWFVFYLPEVKRVMAQKMQELEHTKAADLQTINHSISSTRQLYRFQLHLK